MNKIRFSPILSFRNFIILIIFVRDVRGEQFANEYPNALFVEKIIPYSLNCLGNSPSEEHCMYQKGKGKVPHGSN